MGMLRLWREDRKVGGWEDEKVKRSKVRGCEARKIRSWEVEKRGR
jgi:hypothetical protein